MSKKAPSALIIENFASMGGWLTVCMGNGPIIAGVHMQERVSAFQAATTLLRRAKLNRTDRKKAFVTVEKVEQGLLPAHEKYRVAKGGRDFKFSKTWFRYLKKRVSEPY